MTRADFELHPANDRRSFDNLPIQICGAYEQTRNEDGDTELVGDAEARGL